MNTSHQWRRGLGYTAITIIMWGLLPIALKGLVDVMDPLTITWYRFFASALIALLWYGYRSGNAMRSMLSRDHRHIAAAAAIGLIINYALYIWGLAYITAGASQILIQMAPMMLLLGSVYFFRERLSALQWLGVVMLLGGFIAFFHLRLTGANLQNEGNAFRLGVALTILASVGWAIYALAQKRMLIEGFNAKDILLFICLAGTLFYLPLANPLQILSLNTTQLALLGFCSLNTIAAYGSFGLAMAHWESSRVSALIPVAPLLTLLFIALFNHLGWASIDVEPANWVSHLGAIMVVAGAGLAALAGQRH